MPLRGASRRRSHGGLTAVLLETLAFRGEEGSEPGSDPTAAACRSWQHAFRETARPVLDEIGRPLASGFAHGSHRLGTDAHDCFARRNVAELTIELATRKSDGRIPGRLLARHPAPAGRT